MQFSFDLISDLHVETWDQEFDWSGQATSQFCVVAGDVARDRDTVFSTLTNVSDGYQATFYIDGNDEHKDWMDDISSSYQNLAKNIEENEDLVFLQDNVVIIDGVAILATNGWWSFDLDVNIDSDQSRMWFQERSHLTREQIDMIEAMAFNDAKYLSSSVQRLQTHPDVKKIVIVTHTVPCLDLIKHDVDLDGNYRMNSTGNPYLLDCLNYDTEKKISTWCFGHYHGDVDCVINGIRFVNNCHGRGNTAWNKSVYHPKRITIDI
jgi:predicted phosphodiesterase